MKAIQKNGAALGSVGKIISFLTVELDLAPRAPYQNLPRIFTKDGEPITDKTFKKILLRESGQGPSGFVNRESESSEPLEFFLIESGVWIWPPVHMGFKRKIWVDAASTYTKETADAKLLRGYVEKAAYGMYPDSPEAVAAVVEVSTKSMLEAKLDKREEDGAGGKKARRQIVLETISVLPPAFIARQLIHDEVTDGLLKVKDKAFFKPFIKKNDEAGGRTSVAYALPYVPPYVRVLGDHLSDAHDGGSAGGDGLRKIGMLKATEELGMSPCYSPSSSPRKADGDPMIPTRYLSTRQRNRHSSFYHWQLHPSTSIRRYVPAIHRVANATSSPLCYNI